MSRGQKKGFSAKARPSFTFLRIIKGASLRMFLSSYFRRMLSLKVLLPIEYFITRVLFKEGMTLYAKWEATPKSKLFLALFRPQLPCMYCESPTFFKSVQKGAIRVTGVFKFSSALDDWKIFFSILAFSNNFCPISKMTCLVTLFDLKFKGFKYSPKLTIFGLF